MYRSATQDDKMLVLDILTSSFQNNTSVRYLTGHAGAPDRIRGLMEYSYKMCALFGKVYISSDNTACALVSFPEQKKTSISTIWQEIRLIFNSIGLRNMSKAIKREKAIAQHYPSGEPIYYLWFIGVLPQCQRQGIGEELISKILAEADQMQRRVYLETSTLENIPWYQKFGFRVYAELDFGYTLFLLKR
jgi:ribosomal protein S18 acetylase RimI-like enzyme